MIRRTLILASTIVALLSPAHAGRDAMTPDEARHLISRTGFGAAPHEINAMIGMSYAQGVAQILDAMGSEPTTPMPAWATGWMYPHDQIWTLGQTQSEQFNTNRYLELNDLSGWWLAEMAATPTPLTERMVLFWSDHFANSFEAHDNSQWMAAQNRFLRHHAAGDFAILAQGMVLDPAMLEYLDNVSNVAGAPNENLAREFLELFTLGEGRGYTQDDVRAAARMLTGYTISDVDSQVIFEADSHDAGPKTIFGQTGGFDARDLVELALAHPDFGPFVVENLWREFVSDTPDPVEVARLTALWKDQNLAIKPLLEALFLTDAFWDPASRGRLIKSPVELIVGTTRTLGLSLPKAQDMVWMMSELDQALFLPPNVGGWPDGTEWINDATASARATMLSYLIWGAGEPVAINRTPMMAGGLPAPATPLGAQDLRVGQVFATYVEDREDGDGLGGAFTLFDVGFRGNNWRSISLWLEYDAADDFTALYLYNGDCDGDCLTTLPDDGDDDGWVAFAPSDGMLDENPDISEPDIALMQAVGAHLQDLIATTSTHVPFGVNPYDPDQQAAPFAPFMAAARTFAIDSAAVIGRTDGQLVIAFSQPNSMGLSEANTDAGVDDLDAHTQTQEARPFVAATTYDANNWIDALHGSGPEAARAAKTLFAVPQVSPQSGQALRVDDPDDLLMRLVLSPEFQVN